MPTGKTILILGGGVGGIVAANRLRRALPSTHRVILVEREASHVFAPSLLWLMVGARTLPAISRTFEGLKRKGIEVVRGEVDAIDPEHRRVVVSGQALEGDYVIVALGADFHPEAVPGLVQGGTRFAPQPEPRPCGSLWAISRADAFSSSPQRPPTSARRRPTKRPC